MAELEQAEKPGGRFLKGISGNKRGRPKRGEAIAEQARIRIKKHRILDRITAMACGKQGTEKNSKDVDVRVQLEAARMLLAYGFGQPTKIVETNERKVQEIRISYERTQNINA